MSQTPKSASFARLATPINLGEDGAVCVFNIVFGTDGEGGLLRGESARPEALSAKKALLKTSCGFIELSCHNIVPQMIVCKTHRLYL